MPAVVDKININKDSLIWNFSNYQPDLVTIGLGQNDGIQDSAKFCTAYISFIKQLRSYYPNARIILLNSPMADEPLRNFLEKSAQAVIQSLSYEGEKKIHNYSFKKRYIAGCDSHPSLQEHIEISDELTAFIRKTLRW